MNSKIYPALLLAMCLMSSLTLRAQIILTHAAPITELHLNTNETLLVTDAEGVVYRQGRYKLDKSSYSRLPQNLNGYRIKDYELIHITGDVYTKMPLDFIPQALTLLGTRPLLASKEGLWILDNNQAKRYYIPGLNFPSNIQNLTVQGSLVTMITDNQSLHVYDTLHQVLTYIDKKVTDAIMDKWQCLWYTDGQRLYQDNRFVSDKPPDLQHLKIVARGARVVESPFVIKDNAEDYRITYQGQYSPSYHDLRYAYRYDNQEWIDLGGAESFQLSNLQPGKHQVFVKAMGLEGTNSAVVSSLSFEIEGTDYSYLIKWGIGLMLGLLGLSFIGSLRARSQMKSLVEEKEKIKMQLALVNEKQKLGQAQMNPHFLFNALNGISGLIATKDLVHARKSLQSFSKMMRTVLDGSRSQSISIGEEIQFLSSYLRLEQMLRPDNFEFTINSALPEETLIPPMIIQPFVENAVIHGMGGLDRVGKIEVHIQEYGQYALATVIDNGKGRKNANAKKTSSHKSAAINIVEERLSLLDKWSKKPHISYNDLVDDNQKSTGTKVTIQITKL